MFDFLQLNEQHELTPDMVWLQKVLRLNSKTPLMIAIIALLKQKTWPDLNYHTISPEMLDHHRIHRASAYRALKLMESEGLVQVLRNRSVSPAVSLIGINEEQDHERDPCAEEDAEGK